jgi:hypothetical protein
MKTQESKIPAKGKANISAYVSTPTQSKTQKEKTKKPSKRQFIAESLIKGLSPAQIAQEVVKSFGGAEEKEVLSVNTIRSDMRFFFGVFSDAGLVSKAAVLPSLLSHLK